MIAVRTLRKLVDNRDRQPGKEETEIHAPEIGAERAEEKEFEESKKRDSIPEHYRTKIDKY